MVLPSFSWVDIHPKFHKTPLTGNLAALQKDDKPDWPRTHNIELRRYLDPDKSDGFSMDGATTDVMVGDGTSVYLRHLRFDGKLAPQAHGAPHLYSTTRLLDDAAAHRTHWLFGTGDTRPLGVSYEWAVCWMPSKEVLIATTLSWS